MSLGLPEFGSRGQADPGVRVWRAVRLVGFALLVYLMGVGAIEWQAASASRAAVEEARAAAARTLSSAEDERRLLLKSGDLLIATASIESSPARMLEDLNQVVPQGVTIPGIRIEYTAEGLTRLDLTVVAPNPETYDQFLAALSNSPKFSDIKPGAEVRPGLVKATLSAVHRPKTVSK